MDYLYENLGDERFQEFCANLISKEFPDIQAFPVGQPDGGRDAISYSMETTKKKFIVFQVKYVKNPHNGRDAYTWLEEIITQEAPKINKLISKGAIKYYLCTNAKGTAHLNVGMIDKINKLLEEKINIPSLCWWREDLNVLFEKDPLFKWSFAEILNGQDVLNSVLFDNLKENKDRREGVIKAYLTDQYEMDNEVKFKQIDLQNKLLNLFTDVPLKIKKFNEKDKELNKALESIFGRIYSFAAGDGYFLFDESESFGAAEFLLHPNVQNRIGKVLLEGGPGQGKSTISQYVCQTHRVKLLNKHTDVSLLPPKIKSSPIRLPFKIDLRDIAAWVEKKNPYQESFSKEYFDTIWKNSLEAFLVTHIHYHSKLDDFGTSDFVAICKSSPVLLVFDGFDEIADIKIRSEVIDFINKGVSRLSSNSNSIQVVVTSRPAAFSNFIGFSVEHYPHFELTDVTPAIITEYVEKWLKASNLSGRDAMEIRKLVQEKLDLPHLKELAKSPMQLAIFLSLLRTKGQSLPNKRTALYDSYINLFFDRESEKNFLIRARRDLVINIHYYLAWVLHSEAELYKKNGSIQFDDLRTKLKDYLEKEGQDTLIADQLFDVMKERVCALVSRVQGTFEFEVQPLREYFCAKYLYTTAQNSTAGSIKSGSKPDRLNSILRSSYWQNVVRFFAGCADAGELDMIIQELRDLQNDELLQHTNYPQLITSQILSDYVFSQKPKKQKEAVKIILEAIESENITSQQPFSDSTEPITLPVECGREDMIIQCFKKLSTFPAQDYCIELINVINYNSTQNLSLWNEFAQLLDEEGLTNWLGYAQGLRLIPQMDDSYLIKLLNGVSDEHFLKRLQLIFSEKRHSIVHKDIELKRKSLLHILDGNLSIHEKSKEDNSLRYFSLIFQPYILSNIFNRNDDLPFIEYLDRYMDPNNGAKIRSFNLDFEVQDEVDLKIKAFIEDNKKTLNAELIQFKTNSELWDKLVESGRLFFSDNWKFFIIATIAARLKSTDDKNIAYSDLFNSKLSLCKRVRFARLKSGNIKFWKNKLENSNDLEFTLLILFTWGTPKTIFTLLPTLSKQIKLLKAHGYSRLVRAIKSVCYYSSFTKSQLTYIINETSQVGGYNEIKYLLSLRFDRKYSDKYVFDFVANHPLAKGIPVIKLRYAMKLFLENRSDTEILLAIKKNYQECLKIDWSGQLYLRSTKPYKKISYEIAKMITKDKKSYPKILCSIAERHCRIYANKRNRPIGKIAKQEDWFIED